MKIIRRSKGVNASQMKSIVLELNSYPPDLRSKWNDRDNMNNMIFNTFWL